MIDFNLVLEADNVRLRPMVTDDFYLFEPLTNDSLMWTYFTKDLSSVEELSKWTDTAIREMKNKTRLAFTIIDLSTGRVAGSTSFGNLSAVDKRLEIGWTWISKDFQGKGINDTAKYLMLRYAFDELDLERVEFKTDVLNQHARRALVRIGAIEEGILRSHMLVTHGRRRDSIYYSILKQEWESLRSKINLR